ncbi:hypothetical protein MLD38_040526 [Melastoma candidum]|nr:hypothetical protein MLD38_040526 [Melastoma candidum]
MFQFARLSLACPWIQQQFERSNCRIGKIGCYRIALYRLSSRVGDKRTRTADIRHRNSCGSGGSSYRRTRNGELSPLFRPTLWS